MSKTYIRILVVYFTILPTMLFRKSKISIILVVLVIIFVKKPFFLAAYLVCLALNLFKT